MAMYYKHLPDGDFWFWRFRDSASASGSFAFLTTKEFKAASKDVHKYQSGCSPLASLLCPQLLVKRAHQISLLSSPALSQHGKTYFLGQSCKTCHPALAPEKVNYGGKEDMRSSVLAQLHWAHLHSARTQSYMDFFQSNTLGIASLAAGVCHIPLAPRCDLLSVQINTVFPQS